MLVIKSVCDVVVCGSWLCMWAAVVDLAVMCGVCLDQRRDEWTGRIK